VAGGKLSFGDPAVALELGNKWVLGVTYQLAIFFIGLV